MGIGFVGFINELCGVGTSFFGSVVVSSHEPEHEVEEVMCRFWLVFEDFIWDCVWSGGYTGRRLVACGGVTVLCEVFI